MAARAQLLRQFHVVERLLGARGRPVPFEELRRSLLAQHTVADWMSGYELRTFQRDIGEIADLFGLHIVAVRGQGYVLADDGPGAASDGGAPPFGPDRQRLLEALALSSFLRLPGSLAPFVQPEPRRALGLEHLGPLLRATQAGRVVEIDYQKHWDDAPSRRTCGPLLLRESRGRWYVLALMVGSGRLACFGLDRVTALETTERPFAPPAGFDPATYFADCFGITRPTDGQVPQEIVLRFAPTQGRYALSYPLHPSQRLLHDDGAGIEISLRVYDTHELRMELLSYADAVEVLAPPALRAWHGGNVA